jgi:hypothetical protein
MVDSNGESIRAFYIPMEKKTIIRDELLNMYSDAGERQLNIYYRMRNCLKNGLRWEISS